MEQAWKTICPVEEIPRQGARVLQREGMHDVAIFRNQQDQIFALLDRCPHKGGPLSQGMVVGDHVACPLHNWHIELRSGEAVSPDVGCAVRFAVRINDGVVQLNSQELADIGKVN